MARFLPNRLFAAALLVSTAAAAVPVLMPQPALAQDDGYAGGEVSFQVFYDQLAPYGRWFQSARWGYVWHPEDAGPDFRPYYNGHWVRTDRYGWYWVSNEEWGDTVYHYGRWVYDPDDGWLWIPGYVWAPAWVVWREGDGMTGWFPMPPDDGFYNGDEDYNGYTPVDDYYGYDQWYGPSFNVTFFSLFVFVDNDHFGDEHFHRFVRNDFRDPNEFRRTRDQTNITVVNNFVVNNGVDPQQFHGRNGRPFRTVRLEDVQRRDAPRPVPVNMGRQIHQRELRQRADFRPHWMEQGGTLRATPFTAKPMPKGGQPQPFSENPQRMNGKPLFVPQDQEQGGPSRREHRNGRPPHGTTPGDNSPPGDTGTPHVMQLPGGSENLHEAAPETERLRNAPPPAERVQRFERHSPPDMGTADMPVRRFERHEVPQNAVPPQVPVRRFEHHEVPQNAVPPQTTVQRFVPQNVVHPQAPVQRLEHSEPPPEQARQRSHDEDSSPPERKAHERRDDHHPEF